MVAVAAFYFTDDVLLIGLMLIAALLIVNPNDALILDTLLMLAALTLLFAVAVAVFK